MKNDLLAEWKKIRKEADRSLKDVRKKVDKNKGNIALVARQILVKPGNGHMRPSECYHLEAGVISGKIKKQKEESLVERAGSGIELKNASLGFMNSYYHYSPEFSIPVEKKIC